MRAKRELNPFLRYQVGLAIADVFPERADGRCRCGCGVVRPKGRAAWASAACSRAAVDRFLVLKGDTSRIRSLLLERDGGVCCGCGLLCEGEDRWEADHIIPVERGGGACDLSGFQTLCIPCHRAKTDAEASERRAA